MVIAVLGAGAWGGALAIQLARAGCEVRLWTHNQDAAAQMHATRSIRQLPNCLLPESMQITAELSAAVSAVDGVLIAVPSHAFSALLQQLIPLSLPTQLAWATKGFDPVYHHLLHQRVASELPQVIGTVLSGPTFASEVAIGLPTAMVAASKQVQAAEWWAKCLHSTTFRVYTNDDVLGVEIGGALKNVMAIAAGISDGLGFGANARAALVSRALAEVMRLGACLGAKPDTFMGLAGLGDLVLTCTDDQSRNRRFGLALAAGQSVSEAEFSIGTVEGVAAVKSVVVLAKHHQLDMPIAQAVYAVIKGKITPRDAVAQLLARAPKAERQ
jgi:glycerol-3-phosphate dehydrogenase (NAD(P)+)